MCVNDARKSRKLAVTWENPPQEIETEACGVPFGPLILCSLRAGSVGDMCKAWLPGH
jgi:hypothetical protein